MESHQITGICTLLFYLRSGLGVCNCNSESRPQGKEGRVSTFMDIRMSGSKMGAMEFDMSEDVEVAY